MNRPRHQSGGSTTRGSVHSDTADRGTSSLQLLLVGLALIAGCLVACGEAYSTQAPAQKVGSSMVLVPDHARAGQVFELHAVIFTLETLNYVSDYDFGADIDVLDFDSGGGLGCEEVDTSDISVPDLFDQTSVFPLCLTMVAQSTADPGERSVSVEIQSDGTVVIARSEFYVLPAFQ